MIDHLIRFNSEADALADPVVGAYAVTFEDGSQVWRRDICFPGIQCWQTSGDVTTTDDSGNAATVHSYLPYWYICISKPQLDAALKNHPTCMLVADRDAAEAGSPAFILYVPAALMTALDDYNVAPMPLGSHYPFGSVTPS